MADMFLTLDPKTPYTNEVYMTVAAAPTRGWTLKEVTEATGLDKAFVKEALYRWVSMGVLYRKYSKYHAVEGVQVESERPRPAPAPRSITVWVETSLIDRVYQLVAASDTSSGWTPSQIAARINRSYPTARELLNRLYERGMVDKVDGKYFSRIEYGRGIAQCDETEAN